MAVSQQILVHGKVQGVGYRWAAQQVAQTLGIRIKPLNLKDGSVQISISGESQAVKKFVSWCKQGPPSANVQKVEVV